MSIEYVLCSSRLSILHVIKISTFYVDTSFPLMLTQFKYISVILSFGLLTLETPNEPNIRRKTCT